MDAGRPPEVRRGGPGESRAPVGDEDPEMRPRPPLGRPATGVIGSRGGETSKSNPLDSTQDGSVPPRGVDILFLSYPRRVEGSVVAGTRTSFWLGTRDEV